MDLFLCDRGRRHERVKTQIYTTFDANNLTLYPVKT